MVKIPIEECDPYQHLREWLYRYEIEESSSRREHFRLVDLEECAHLAANFVIMNRLQDLSDYNNFTDFRQVMMNRIRHFFNLEFKMRCDVCGSAHVQDEISAPER